jgi:hypothetical protein
MTEMVCLEFTAMSEEQKVRSVGSRPRILDITYNSDKASPSSSMSTLCLTSCRDFGPG